MTFIGVVLSAFSVSLMGKANFGYDPFQVLSRGLWNLTSIDFGTFYMAFNLCLFVVMFIINRAKIGVTTFINMFFLGYLIDFFGKILDSLIPETHTVTASIILLLALVITSLAAALYYVGDLGVSTYDVIAITWAENSKLAFKYCRIICDTICIIIGYLLGGKVGIATVITAIGMGPLIAFFIKHVAMPIRYGKNPPENTLE